MVGILNAIGFLLSPLTALWRAVVGDRSAKDTQIHAEQMAAHSAYMAEWQIARGGFWNGFVDAINRLVRPAMTIGVIYVVFVFPWADPQLFTVYVKALGLVPQPLWDVMWAITAFWFGSRVVEKVMGRRIEPPRLADAAKIETEARMLAGRGRGLYNGGSWATKELRRRLEG